jgi:hypothetical protein
LRTSADLKVLAAYRIFAPAEVYVKTTEALA